MNITIDDALKLHKGGIAAFVNKVDQMIYIADTNSMLKFLERNTYKIVNGSHNYPRLMEDYKKLEFIVVEYIEDVETRKYLLGYYINKYINAGYKLYNRINYRKCYIASVTDYIHTRIYVVLRNAGYKDVVLGVFDSYKESELFKAGLFNSPFILPVCCTNALTRAYMIEHQL